MLNNSLSKHSSDRNRPLSSPEHLKVLAHYQKRLRAVVYFRTLKHLRAPTVATTYIPGRYCVSYITWLIKSWRGGERKRTFPAMRRAAKYANQPASVKYPSDYKGQSRTAHNKQERSFPGRKLDTYAGNRLTWHEWYGKFRSAVDSTQLSQDVKLTCLKT